jgi:hypothetical protein
VCDVVLGEQGLDRITVRLSVVQVTAIPASWETLGGAAKPGWKRMDVVTNLDWEFVRPAGQRTDPGAVLLPVTCAVCGGPYRSDLDDACPHCGIPRPDTQAGWRLDCTYQVVTVQTP